MMMDAPARSKSNGVAMDQSTIAVYLGTLGMTSLVYQSFHDIGLSTLLTLSLGLQLFAYACVMLKVVQQKSVAGLSGKSLCMQAVSIGLRLSSTTCFSGYIPVDATGDWLYQILDVSALFMALALIYLVYKVHRRTYQDDCDTFNISNTLIVCFVLAVLVHPDLNARPIFDTLWTAGLYVDVVAMVPQLWMMSKIGGEVEALNCHYVGAVAVSRSVSLAFWFYGFTELAPLDGGFNIAGWAIISAHVVQVLLLLDFLIVYIKACMFSGYSPRLQLPTHDV